MISTHSLQLPFSPELADQGNVWLRRLSQRHQFDQQAAFQLGVCLAEALNNISQHTPACSQQNLVSLRCQIEHRWLTLEVRHQAPAYTLPGTESVALEDESGRGWLIMQQWLSSVEYQHHQGCNLLLLRKQIYGLSPEPASS